MISDSSIDLKLKLIMFMIQFENHVDDVDIIYYDFHEN